MRCRPHPGRTVPAGERFPAYWVSRAGELRCIAGAGGEACGEATNPQLRLSALSTPYYMVCPLSDGVKTSSAVLRGLNGGTCCFLTCQSAPPPKKSNPQSSRQFHRARSTTDSIQARLNAILSVRLLFHLNQTCCQLSDAPSTHQCPISQALLLPFWRLL